VVRSGGAVAPLRAPTGRGVSRGGRAQPLLSMGLDMKSAGTLAVLTVLAFGSTAWATTAADICSPAQNPCLVSAKLTVTNGSVLDFGARALEIQTGGQLDVGTGQMTIMAGSLVLRPNGVLKALGGTITVITAGNVLVEVAGASRGRIDVSGPDGGNINLCTPACLGGAGGTLTLNGDLLAHATVGGAGGLGGTGGTVLVVAQSALVTATGAIRATGGASGSGGSVDLSTVADITLNGPINVAGGSNDGGDITLDAGGNVTTSAELNLNGRVGDYGSGGLGLDIFALGGITLNGNVDGRAAGNLVSGGGDGADIFLLADTGNVTINGPMLAEGAPPDGFGGDIDILADGGSITLNGLVSSRCPGTDAGTGGDVSLSAGAALTINNVDVSGGTGGGSLDADAISGTLTVNGTVNGNGIVVGAFGGAIDLAACDIVTAATANLTTTGVAGVNRIRGSDDINLLGHFTAGAGNTIFYRNAAKPPVVAGAVFAPGAAQVLDPAMAPCGGFPTTSTTSTTTTSTSTSTTTTTSTSTTSTTTTTVTVPITTTTTTTSTTSTTKASTTTTVPASTTTTTTTTTTTSSVASTTTTSSTSSSSTTVAVSSTTTSSSTTAPTSSTTSTTAPLPLCTPGPGACDDGDLCTEDRCDAATGCAHDPVAGYAAVLCRLDTMATTIASEPVTAFGRLNVQRKLASKVQSARGRVASAEAAAKKRGKLKRARSVLASFMKSVQRGVATGRIDGPVGARLLALASGATSGIQPLVDAAVR
jgi:hypothetical protein